MREKSEQNKRKEGRGIPTEFGYEAWKTARESKSTATACALYDPIQQRTVNLMSQGEVKVFWTLRFFTNGHIYEQVPLNEDAVYKICREHGFRVPRHILSTDLLVEKNDGSYVAISIKQNHKVFEGDTKAAKNACIRQEIDEIYWNAQGVEQRVVYSEDIDTSYVGNIKDVMFFWEERFVTDDTSKLMHMIAHHAIRLPFNKGRLKFKKLAEQLDVKEMYETYTRRKDDPEFQGWEFDLH